jgi:hypothetical protein
MEAEVSLKRGRRRGIGDNVNTQEEKVQEN